MSKLLATKFGTSTEFLLGQVRATGKARLITERLVYIHFRLGYIKMG